MTLYIGEMARRHPALAPRDAIKAAYQAAFGAEHLLRDAGTARERLREEMEGCAPKGSLPLWEALSPDTCRVNLAPWKAAGLPEAWLAALFARSCVPRKDGEARFLEALDSIGQKAAEGRLPFSSEEWQTAKADYLSGGIRPVHHSAGYRAAERPAYRAVDYRYIRLVPLLLEIRREPRQIIALDGRCASGKTTLAGDLSEIAGASVIHMDDFFLPPELRTPERLAEPGGNVHYERFAAEVLPGLKSGRDFRYGRFDCGKMALDGYREVPASGLYIVEGAYCCHPALGEYMTLRAFSDIAPEEQKRRILLRNGKAGWESFRARWIPLEENYISALRIREKARIILPSQAPSGDR